MTRHTFLGGQLSRYLSFAKGFASDVAGIAGVGTAIIAHALTSHEVILLLLFPNVQLLHFEYVVIGCSMVVCQLGLVPLQIVVYCRLVNWVAIFLGFVRRSIRNSWTVSLILLCHFALIS